HNNQFKWILNAWQFYYASGKVFYGAMQRLGQCVVHHLIGRYATQGKFRGSIFWDFSGHSFCIVGK
ncbi:hypothetical protein, partial [Vibrio sp. 1180_3]|uniref:hypothetical protein n=1 Tax=Vibrio sp. 1180_3 TaxID=2528832 RepID=UPI003217A74C